MDAGRVEPAETLHEEFGVEEDVRRAATVEVDAPTLADIETRLDEAGPAIADYFGTTVSAREGTSFLRYGAGGFYLPHVDRAETPAWPAAARRKIAVVVFLNSSLRSPGAGDFAGGELHVIGADRRVVPLAGRIAAFDAGLLHEVAPILEGTRDVIVDWFY